MMDNHLKIQALMIYYQHWGNEQNKIRKTLDGVDKFQKIYDEHGFMMRMSCRSYLKRHKRRTWHHIADLLLGECGGGFQPIDLLPEIYDRVNTLRKHTLHEDRIGQMIFHWNTLGENFSETNALSVDAIISLR